MRPEIKRKERRTPFWAFMNKTTEAHRLEVVESLRMREDVDATDEQATSQGRRGSD